MDREAKQYLKWLIIVALIIVVANMAHGQNMASLSRRNALVTSDWSQGSGVIFKTDSVLTVAHVLGPHMKVNGKEARVVSLDTLHDLMVLGTSTDSVPTIKLDLVVSPLKGVITIGNPLGKRNFVSAGYIEWSDGETMNTSNLVMPGFSGGGAYDHDGALLGIVRAGEGNCTFGYTINQVVTATRVLEYFLSPPQDNPDSVLAQRALLPKGKRACERRPP